MDRNTIIACRGQVWHLVETTNITEDGIQSGTRPYVIISSDIGNASNSPVVSVLPCTSKVNEHFTHTSINVQYRSSRNNKDCLVLCNQVRTITKDELFHKGKYMETLSPDVLHEVEKAYAHAMGMTIADEQQYMNIDKLIQTVENIANNRIQSMRTDREVTDDMILEIAMGLESIFNKSLGAPKKTSCQKITLHNTDGTETVDSDNQSKLGDITPELIQFHNACKNKGNETKNNVNETSETSPEPSRPSNNVSSGKASAQSKRKPNGYWTVERCKAYVADKKTMSPRQLADKWDLNSPGAAVSQYYNALNILEKAGMGDATK